MNMTDLVAIPLPDGRWLALPADVLSTGLARAASMGLGAATTVATGTSSSPEKWLTSEELQALTGIHSTSWEARARSGEVPCIRVGKALRFKLGDVEAAVRAKT